MDILVKKAQENLQAADLLEKQSLFNAAMNCLYHHVYLLVYRKLLVLGIDNEENAVEKHKRAVDYLFQESKKKNPDAAVACQLLCSLKGARVKANYKRADISPEEYRKWYGEFKKNERPLARAVKIEEEEVENV